MWQWIKSLLGDKGEKVAGQTHPGITDVGDAIIVQLMCDRCQEALSVRLRKSSDIQRNYDGSGPEFYVRKTVVGQKCFNRIELELEMDARYRPIATNVQRGKVYASDNEA